MNQRILPAAVAVVTLGLGVGACGGGSSGSGSNGSGGSSSSTNDAAACQQLANDTQVMQAAIESAKTHADAASKFKTAASKFRADGSGGSSTLQEGANKLADVLESAATSAAQGKAPNAASFAGELQTAEKDISTACPNIALGTTTSPSP